MLPVRSRLLALAVLLLPMTSPAGQRRSREPVTCRLLAHAVEGEDPSHRPGGTRRFSRAFFAYETAAIELDVSCRGGKPLAAPTQVKFFLPGGELYRGVPLTPFEQDRKGSRGKATPLVGTARLPVRGTFITQNQLYGEWRVEVCREMGSQELCADVLSFEISSGSR
ncbi:MAG TPA: hypothetical protein VIG29_17470 [Vicinamibacteria bacterium]